MNYNIIAYGIYGLLTIYIILFVGKLFHKNGRIFIIFLSGNKEKTADTTNDILLIGYYLFNIGYAILQFSYWNQLTSFNELLTSIAMKMGILILLLAGMHYINILVIYILSKNNTNSLNIKQ